MIVRIKFLKPFRFFSNISCQFYLFKRSYKVLFFGSDDFSLYSLKELHNNLNLKECVSSIDVVTSSRKNLVAKYAEDKNLGVYSWAKSLDCSSYDLGVIVSFGHLIPKKMIDSFPLGMLNVHASLLPRWRGASPIVHAILNGDSITGITIMKINPHHFDTGDIILQKECSIGPDELMPSLYKRLGQLGATCLIETLSNLPTYISNSIRQANENVTFAPRIKSDIGTVNWKEQSSTYIYNLYRALYSIYDIKTCWHSSLVKLKKISFVSHEEHCKEPGIIEWNRSKQQLMVWCRAGCIAVETLSLGGKTLSAKDFYNGYLSKKHVYEWFFR